MYLKRRTRHSFSNSFRLNGDDARQEGLDNQDISRPVQGRFFLEKFVLLYLDLTIFLSAMAKLQLPPKYS